MEAIGAAACDDTPTRWLVQALFYGWDSVDRSRR